VSYLFIKLGSEGQSHVAPPDGYVNDKRGQRTCGVIWRTSLEL